MNLDVLYISVYFLILLALDVYYLSKHSVIFGEVGKIKNKVVKYTFTIFSILLSFSLIFLPAILYNNFLVDVGYPKWLMFGLGGLAYLLAVLIVAYQKQQDLRRFK